MSDRDDVRNWLALTPEQLADVDITDRGDRLYAAWREGRVELIQVTDASVSYVPFGNPDGLAIFKAKKIDPTFGDTTLIPMLRESLKNDARMAHINSNADADRKVAAVLLSELKAINVEIDENNDLWWWPIGALPAAKVKITTS